MKTLAKSSVLIVSFLMITACTNKTPEQKMKEAIASGDAKKLSEVLNSPEMVKKGQEAIEKDTAYNDKIRRGVINEFTPEEKQRWDSENTEAVFFTLKKGNGKAIEMLSDSQKILLGKPLDPNLRNKQGETLLIAAVKVGSKDVVSTLMKLGADPSLKGSDGKDAIEQATEMKRTDLISVMKKK